MYAQKRSGVERRVMMHGLAGKPVIGKKCSISFNPYESGFAKALQEKQIVSLLVMHLNEEGHSNNL
jgi:hypothetical protein